MSMSSRLHPEIPALVPTVAKAMRLVLCLALIAAIAMILRTAVFEHFHGSDAPVKAVLALFGP